MKPPPAGHLVFESLGALPGLCHVVTTRAEGASRGPYASLNLSFRTGDDAAAVRENRRRAAALIGADPSRLVVPQQCHGAAVARVEAADAGRGALDDDALPGVDAAVTATPDLPLLVLSADCPLVLLYDPERRALGAAHASWRGTTGEIVMRTVEALQADMGCAPDALWAGISPSIGPCCYAVGPDLVARLERERPYALDFLERRGGRTHLNLWDLNWHQLVAAGLRADQIEVARRCTRCDAARFYSHRRDGAATGRFGLLAMIAPASRP